MWPTRRPSSPSSSLTRAETVIAAIRRGWVQPISRPVPAGMFQAELGDLGGLAGAGIPGDDDHLVGGEEIEDLLAMGGDRKGLR